MTNVSMTICLFCGLYSVGIFLLGLLIGVRVVKHTDNLLVMPRQMARRVKAASGDGDGDINGK